MTQQTYTVANISCAHCTHTIEQELKLVSGVKTVSADLNSKRVTVTVDAPPTLTAVENMLVEIGYPGTK